ncbi:isopeptide-forming domain-containing fimbrial protein [Luteimonas sp. RC10]|uniref:DUF7927 domain-containing protein n=1 Tax=Luteimonas sp. RC10 TaxID=2587035 RepID=UPI00161F6260
MTNVATVSAPAGTNDIDLANNTANATVTVARPVVEVVKSADPLAGSIVTAGQVITYTLNVRVTEAATQSDVVLSDTLSAGLIFGAVTSAGSFVEGGSGNARTFTLPTGTAPGEYSVVYTATVSADAQTSVGNVVIATGGGDPDDPQPPSPTCTSCATEHPLASVVTVTKTSDPVSGSEVSPGDTLTYTVTATVASAATTEMLTLADTLGAGLTFGAVTNAGAFACTGTLTCTLPAGTLPGTYTLTYTATVDAAATGSVGNVVTATTPPGGNDPPPVCTTCETEHPVVATSITVSKSSNPASGSEVSPGDTLTYTLTATVANSATTEVLTLSDTLGSGLTFGAVTDAGAFACTGALTCTLPAGMLPGTYTLTYTATVNADATGNVGNVVTATTPPGGNDPEPVCTTCETEHPVVATSITVSKSSNPASGSEVSPGDTLTYTLTATVANSATTEVLTLSDTLGSGLTFGAVIDAGAFACTGALSCTLPAGTLPGSYTLTYTATVNADATGSVGNVVTASTPPGGNDPEPVCTTCETEHPVVATSITVSKSSNPASGSEVSPGDTLTYTLAATVANSATTEVLTLADTLGAGLTFGAVTEAGAFACTGALTCTLPAGTLPGTYTLTYTATVNADATGNVGNVVTATTPPGGNDPEPVCTTCETEHPIVATSITVSKSSNPASGSEVSPGDTLTYTLTATVANSATTEVLTLADTLGAGLTFGAVTDAGAFACTGALTCTLPAGTLPGTYTLTYTATVNADATGSVGNVVTATTPPGGNDPPPVCTTCETEHPVVATSITVSKSSNPASGSEVSPGDTLTYALTVTVANSATTEVLTLSDTLGAGLTFGAVTDAGAFACTGALACTLPAGALPGTYTLTYTATVNADATGSVGNVVVATTPPGGNDPEPVCTTCETEHPVVATSITVSKSSNPASGSEVSPGDTLTYTLTATITNSATTEVLTLADTLGAGLTFGAVTDAGAFACTGALSCTLPAGTLPGSYTLTYTATVDAAATGSVGNVVVATNPPGGNDPEPVCTTCETEHPVVATSVTVSKSSNPASGSEVSPGDALTYTLNVTVANSATTEVLTLSDTLGAGLTFGAVTDAGAFACTGALTCTLPAGTLPGTYTLTYTATVNADATGSVGNVVTASTPPGGNDPEPVCTTCETEHPVVATSITVSKSSNPALGSEVSPGDTLTYTLTATVANSATTEVLTLADTLGAGLTFGAVTDAGAFACTGALTCTLPAGTLPGSYTLTYTATVNADATGTVGNVVVATNPPGGNDPEPVCTTCETEHPVVATAITVTKSSNPASGSEVSPGDTLTYTLTATVANSATTEVLTLADTLGAGLTFGSVTNAGAFTCTGALTCTLPAGTLPGTYTLTYTATVNADATGSVGNVVTATTPPGGNDPPPVCTTCETEHPIVATSITVSKSSNPASGSEVSPGDTLTYTLTATVANSATTEVLTLSDTLGAGLTFGSVTNAGAFTCTGALTCTLPAGTLPGTYTLTYTATVNADATGSVGNVVTATTPPGGNDPPPVCTTCETEHPVVATSITVSKSSNPTSGSEVSPGDTLTYTLTATIANSATTEVLTLADTLGAGLTFGAVTDAGAFACTGALSCTLPAGTLPGTYTLTYTATVNADATGSVGNVVTATTPPGGNDPPPVCTTCETEHPVVATSITVSKSSNPTSGSEVSPGDTLTYTLTATIANSATTEVLTLADTLGAGLTFGAVTDAGAFACTGALSCTLPAGTLPGTYTLTYTATVNADATGSVGNVVTATTPPGGNDPEPVCTTCETEHPVVATSITVSKSSNPASGSEVSPGDTLTYTLTATVANSATTEVLTLSDTLGAGLTFGAVTDAGAFACTGALSCTLPAGTLPGSYTLTYTATVNADATGSVGNVVIATNPPGRNDPPPVCTTCETEHPVVATSITVSKSSNPASGSEVSPGDTLTYTLTATIANSATTEVLTLADTLGTGLTFGAVTDAGAFACTGALTCTLPAGTLPGSYTLTYTATVNADATGTVGNVVVATNPPGGNDPEPVCTTCETEHPVVATSITVSKSSNPASGSEVSPGDTLTYTLTATVANSATTEVLTLADTLGSGLTFGAVTDTGAFACTGALTCTLPAGTLPGVYTLTYTATVNADATGSVGNVVVASIPPGGNDPEPVCTTCETEHPVVATSITVSKSSNPASGSEVSPGDTLTYTLTATVANSATTEVLTLADTLGAGLTFGAVTDAGAFACTGALTCTLPAGTLPGTYTLTYTATVNADATGTLSNVVVASTPPGGNDPEPVCTTCQTEHEVEQPTIEVIKTSEPGNGTEVRAGDVLVYTLTVVVANSATLDTLTLTDTLGAGLSFGEVTDAGAFTCTGALTCTLPAGTLPGRYALTYTATVDSTATGTVGNVVIASGGTGENGPPPVCGACSTEHPLAEPRVRIAKHATPGEAQEVKVGDVIEYTLTVDVANSATRSDLRLSDTPGQGLAVGMLPTGCLAEGGNVVCMLPAGTVPGTYTFVYPATVTADAIGTVENRVFGGYTDEGGGSEPECTTCQTRHEVSDKAQLRISKAVGSRTVKIGDLVRYTVTVENVGAVNVTDGIVVDTPPAGFSYVEGSMAVADRDGAFTLTGQYPLRIGGIDIAVGDRATIVYLLRVGAGVRQGVHINEAVAVDATGTPVSNVATAQVSLESDPLLDDSLVFGTVFDDRDGDGWQDRADLSEVQVQGGFASDLYVAGSTTIDRGNGPQPLADASAPLLHGIEIGAISARQSVGDPAEAHRVIIRQRLTAPDFTDDFVLVSGQGVTVRMAADGSTRTERDGEAAKGLNAAEPVVTRRVSAVENGYEVAYIVENHGIDERGIPGVRIASVEGLLIETDQYGRYHLADVQGGDWRHGRNFILKVDPATLPPGTEFTTANPLVRRVTPGLPVRFDFGVRLPVEQIPGGEQRIDLELGEVIFAPGSAEVSAMWLPAIERMAEQVERYGGGDVSIVAEAGEEALAFARAAAVRDALQAQVGPEARAGLSVALRTVVDDQHALVAGVDARGALLGTVLFDTDRAEVKPEFGALLDEVARRLDALGGGVVVLVGHTDVRGSHAYNAALGLRRATAVQQALTARLREETRQKVRVESSADPTAPVDEERK